MADIANFLAQNSPRFNRAAQDRSHFGNALLQNDVDRLPQRNAAEDAAIAADQQAVGQDRQTHARKMAADMLGAIADAPPETRIQLATQIVRGSAFQQVGRDAGLPVDQFNPQPTDDPEQLGQVSRSWAQALGGQGGAQQRVHSMIPLANGNAGYMTENGQVVDTGQKMRESYTPIEVAGGRAAFNRGAGTVAPISSAEDEAAGAGLIAGQQQGAREAATTAAIPGQVTAKTRTERLALQVDEGFSASDAMPVINRAIELLGTVKTGGINAAALAASNLLGVTGADEAELSNNLGKAVLSQLRSTFGAAFTEREGARLDSIEANFGKSTEGNLRLLQQLQKMVEREALRGINAAIQMGDQATADQIREGLGFSLTPGQGGMSFATEAEAAAAEQAGRLKKGQRVTVGGQSGVWQ
jgi:hypothetical protein